MTVYQPSDGIDTYLSGETNRGGDPLLQMPPTGRVLIKFDISDISSSAICSSCVMSLYTAPSSVGSDTWTVYSILSANSTWTESGATWATKDGSNAWAGSDGCSTSGTDYNATAIGSVAMNNSFAFENQFTLTPATVQTWFGGSNTNYGMLIRTNASLNSFYVVASETGDYPLLKPKLVVNYGLSGVRYRRTFHGTRMGSRQGA